jgi:hypothetical protein
VCPSRWDKRKGARRGLATVQREKAGVGRGSLSPWSVCKEGRDREGERRGREGWCIARFSFSPNLFENFENAHKEGGDGAQVFRITKSAMCQSLNFFGIREIGLLSIS